MVSQSSVNNRSLANFTIPDTDSSGNVGIYKIGTTNFLYNFGSNVFMGGAGNLTLGGSSISNTGVGNQSLISLTDGAENTCIGTQAGKSINTGSQNVLFGFCGANITSGTSNVGMGAGAIAALITGSENTAFGHSAGSSYSGAESNNICVGSLVTGVNGESNVTRIGNTQTKFFAANFAFSDTTNLFIGPSCGNVDLTSATSNLCLGKNCLTAIDTGTRNCVVGFSTATSIVAGLDNTFFGNGVCPDLDGSYNVILGTLSGSAYTSSETDNLIIGYAIAGTASESGVTRIGKPGTQTKVFLAGVTTSPVVNSGVVVVDSNGQLSDIGTGNVDEILTSTGTTTPQWKPASTTILTTTVVDFSSSPYVVLPTDQVLLVDSTSGVVLILLEDGAPVRSPLYVKDASGTAGTNAIQISTPSAVTNIDNANTYDIIINNESVEIIPTGTSYYLI